MAEPERFRLRADAMASMARRLNARFALTAGAAAVLVGALFWGGLRAREGGYGALAVGLGLLALLAFFSWRRRLTTFRERWASFTVVLEPDAIGRTVKGYPDLRVARADVASIGEAPAGIVVRARSGEGVVVPRELEGFERVREAVLAWRS